MFNFNEFNNTVSRTVLQTNRLEALLTELGCRINHHRTYHRYRCPCPVHAGDGRNFEVFVGGRTVPVRWQCFSHRCHEKFKASLLGLVHGVLTQQNNGNRVNCMEAVKFLQEFVANAPSTPPKPAITPAPHPDCWQPLNLTREQVRSTLTIPSPYFLGRGFSESVLDHMDIGSSRKLRDWSIVPIYDTDDRCVSFCRRSEHPPCDHCNGYHAEDGLCIPFDPEPKWRFEAGFPKSEYLYNLHNARRSVSPHVVLVEGPGDVWKCQAAAFPAVACFGNSLSSVQVELLAQLRKQVIICLDNDAAGQDGATSAAKRLAEAGVSHEIIQVPSPYHDLGEMPVNDAARLLARGDVNAREAT